MEGPFRLYVNYFTEIQKAIRKNCPEEFYVTVMRRMMFRLAEAIARQEKALALITGENLGQVASQTLESMAVINEAGPFAGFTALGDHGQNRNHRICQENRHLRHLNPSLRGLLQPVCTQTPGHQAQLDQKVREAEEKLDIPSLLAESLEKTQVLDSV
jgi:thiamine biosynthesis protein ThiI